jgi:hypothetical protein
MSLKKSEVFVGINYLTQVLTISWDQEFGLKNRYPGMKVFCL